MPSSVREILGLPPGVHFHPDEDELVEFYLLPRARGEPVLFPSVTVIDDDAAGTTLPWDLLERHGRGGDDEAYFFVRGSSDGEAKKPGARQERRCGGGGKWVSQRRQAPDDKRVTAGERVPWTMHNLNMHVDGGGGSVGWVMHEYVLTDPSFPPVKICHVCFTGHGKNRKRMPGSAVDGQSESAQVMKRARVAAATAGGSSSSGSGGSTTTTVDQYYYCVGTDSADHQAPLQDAFTGEGISDSEWVRELCSDGLQGMLPLAASAAGAATEQLVPEHVTMPMVQESAGMADLEHQYHLCGGDAGQQEFLAPMGTTSMDSVAHRASVTWTPEHNRPSLIGEAFSSTS
jgi:hypothetical protein